MPELPEVEDARQDLDDYLRGKTVATCTPANDEKVIEGCAPAAVKAALEGRKVVKAGRKGKQLWLEFSGKGPHLLIHLGMDGELLIRAPDSSSMLRDFKYRAQKKGVHTEAAWPTSHCKIHLEFTDGTALVFDEWRRFGRLKLVEGPPEASAAITRLGFDPLTEMLPLDEFQTRLMRRKGAKLKAVLLDQAFAAGIGNWVADEILYQALLHPEQCVGDMGPEHVAALHAAIVSIITTAVEVRADASRFPPGWMFHHRWTGKKSALIDGKRIEFVTVGSRTSAFVPAIQKIVRAGSGKEPPAKKAAGAGKKAAAGKAAAGKAAAGNAAAGNVPAGNVPAGNVPAGNAAVGNVAAGNKGKVDGNAEDKEVKQESEEVEQQEKKSEKEEQSGEEESEEEEPPVQQQPAAAVPQQQQPLPLSLSGVQESVGSVDYCEDLEDTAAANTKKPAAGRGGAGGRGAAGGGRGAAGSGRGGGRGAAGGGRGRGRGAGRGAGKQAEAAAVAEPAAAAVVPKAKGRGRNATAPDEPAAKAPRTAARARGRQAGAPAEQPTDRVTKGRGRKAAAGDKAGDDAAVADEPKAARGKGRARAAPGVAAAPAAGRGSGRAANTKRGASANPVATTPATAAPAAKRRRKA